MDPISASFITFGVIVLVMSWIQMLVTSFKEDYTWGLATLFLPPFSYFYGLFELEKAKPALILAAIGGVLVFFGLI